MRRKRISGAARIVGRIDRDPTRGEVYWFLWDEHDAILGSTVGKRISWKTLLTDIQALGLTNAAGLPLDNIRTLQSTFATVCRDKKREAKAKQTKAETRKPPVTNSPPPVAWSTGAYRAPVPALNSTTANSSDGPIDPIERLRLKTLRMSGKRV